jgi:hypothetical protein
VYFSLVVITGAFAALTWITYFCKKWVRYLPVVCAFLFWASTVALALWNVAGTVNFGKPASTACFHRGELDATEAYYMVEGALITIWVTFGIPALCAGLYIGYSQLVELAVDFPSDRKLVSERSDQKQGGSGRRRINLMSFLRWPLCCHCAVLSSRSVNNALLSVSC